MLVTASRNCNYFTADINFLTLQMPKNRFFFFAAKQPNSVRFWGCRKSYFGRHYAIWANY